MNTFVPTKLPNKNRIVTWLRKITKLRKSFWIILGGFVIFILLIIGVKPDSFSIGPLSYNLSKKEITKNSTSNLNNSTSTAQSTTNEDDHQIVKEYIFGNQYFFVQALVDSTDSVLAYGVTTTSSNFNPKFILLPNGYTASDPSSITVDENGKVLSVGNSISDSFTIQLNHTTFDQIPQDPDYTLVDMGARRFIYYEMYYFGNEGNYQSYFFGVNDAGTITKLGNLDFNTNTFDTHNEEIQSFRKNTTINTFFVTVPLFDNQQLKSVWIGPNLDQIRVLPNEALKTNKSTDQLEKEVTGLSAGVNINYFINELGSPLFTNIVKVNQNDDYIPNGFDNETKIPF